MTEVGHVTQDYVDISSMSVVVGKNLRSKRQIQGRQWVVTCHSPTRLRLSASRVRPSAQHVGAKSAFSIQSNRGRTTVFAQLKAWKGAACARTGAAYAQRTLRSQMAVARSAVPLATGFLCQVADGIHQVVERDAQTGVEAGDLPQAVSAEDLLLSLGCLSNSICSMMACTP